MNNKVHLYGQIVERGDKSVKKKERSENKCEKRKEKAINIFYLNHSQAGT